MRARFSIGVRWILPMLACFLLLAAGRLQAQFQAPTEEELKMTADPKAPGADAVYLYREETVDDLHKKDSVYERIKVLTDKGKEMATIQTHYEIGTVTISEIEGRTIHADGTIVPLTVKPEDLMNFKSRNVQINTVVFTLPSVEVGSILEYRLKLRPKYALSEPVWQIQQSQFVHKAHYSFQSLNLGNLMFLTRIGSGAKVSQDNKGLYTLDIEDVPPLSDEDWAPPLNTLAWRVVFYYGYYGSSGQFWSAATRSWAYYVEEFTRPTGRLKKAVAELTSSTDTDEQKARKLYDAILKLDNTDFSRTKSKAERKNQKIKDIKKAEDVWKQRSGNDDEIALLYVALAREAALKAWPMQVVNRNRAMFDNSYLSSGQLDDFIAVVTIDGKDVFLDPGEKMCPFGTLHWKHTLASGFRLSGNDAVLATTPSANYKTAVVQRTADLQIDDEGKVQGTVRIVMTGPDALYWRQLALENDEDEVKKQFNESMKGHIPEGVQADFDHFLALEDYNVNLIGIVKVSGSLGVATGKRFFLPGLFFESNAKHPFVALDKRTSPIDVHYPKTEQDDVTYHLPSGFGVESAPQPTSSAWPQNAMLKITSGTKGDEVEVVRTLLYNFTLLNAKDYPELHDFYQKVAAADQQQLVLTRTAAAKGN